MDVFGRHRPTSRNIFDCSLALDRLAEVWYFESTILIL